jgi:hypothetical protein
MEAWPRSEGVYRAPARAHHAGRARRCGACYHPVVRSARQAAGERLTAELDGGLTRHGFRSDYAWQIGHLSRPATPCSPPTSVRACRAWSGRRLRRRRRARGGTRPVEPLGGDRPLGWRPRCARRGGACERGGRADPRRTVASVPYVATADHAQRFGAVGRAAMTEKAARQGQTMRQFQGALKTTGLSVVEPAFKPAAT